MRDNKIGFGIIGLGMISETHYQALQDQKDCCLIGGFHKDRQKADDWAQKHGNCKAYYTLEDMLSDHHPNCECTRDLLSRIDVLVDGRFVESLKDISLAFRGSSNQRVIDVRRTLEAGSIVLYME